MLIAINNVCAIKALSAVIGLAMQSECLRKDSPNKLYLPKQMGEDQLDDLELDGQITLKILDGIA